MISAATLSLGTGNTDRFIDSWIERKPFLIPPSLLSPPQFILQWEGGFQARGTEGWKERRAGLTAPGSQGLPVPHLGRQPNLSVSSEGINQASQLPGLDEVIHVRAFCKLEASCRGWILESTVNTVTNTNNNNGAQSISVFERYHSLFSPAWNSYWELLSVGPKTNISCISNSIC